MSRLQTEIITNPEQINMAKFDQSSPNSGTTSGVKSLNSLSGNNSDQDPNDLIRKNRLENTMQKLNSRNVKLERDESGLETTPVRPRKHSHNSNSSGKNLGSHRSSSNSTPHNTQLPSEESQQHQNYDLNSTLTNHHHDHHNHHHHQKNLQNSNTHIEHHSKNQTLADSQTNLQSQEHLQDQNPPTPASNFGDEKPITYGDVDGDPEERENNEDRMTTGTTDSSILDIDGSVVDDSEIKQLKSDLLRAQEFGVDPNPIRPLIPEQQSSSKSSNNVPNLPLGAEASDHVSTTEQNLKLLTDQLTAIANSMNNITNTLLSPSLNSPNLSHLNAVNNLISPNSLLIQRALLNNQNSLLSTTPNSNLARNLNDALSNSTPTVSSQLNQLISNDSSTPTTPHAANPHANLTALPNSPLVSAQNNLSISTTPNTPTASNPKNLLQTAIKNNPLFNNFCTPPRNSNQHTAQSLLQSAQLNSLNQAMFKSQLAQFNGINLQQIQIQQMQMEAERQHLKRKREDEEKKRKANEKPHIKKPLNAFMLFMKEQRQKVVQECTLKESAAINQILGRKWHSLSKEEQQSYYDKARKAREEHLAKYPDWSARDNYGKKKRRKKEIAGGSGSTHQAIQSSSSNLHPNQNLQAQNSNHTQQHTQQYQQRIAQAQQQQQQQQQTQNQPTHPAAANPHQHSQTTQNSSAHSQQVSFNQQQQNFVQNLANLTQNSNLNAQQIQALQLQAQQMGYNSRLL